MPNEVDAGIRHPVIATAPGLHLPSGSRLSPNAQRGLPAVFLDRDGVLVRDVHYLRRPSQIALLPGIASLNYLRDRFYLIVATNQSGIARGMLTEDDLLAIHHELMSRLQAAGVVIDAFYYCPHLPGSALRSYNVACNCRKPAPGMLLRAGSEWCIPLASSYMIGDSMRDIQAGCAAGLAGNILVGGGVDGLSHSCRAEDLTHAVRLILGAKPGA